MPIKVPVVQTGLEASIQAAAKKAGRGMKVNMGAGAKSIDGLSQPLGRITGKADQFTKSMEAANARVLAFGASVGVLSAVSRGFKELVTTTIEVEKALTNINSILNVSVKGLDNFKKTIFDVARNTEQSFATVAQAALELSRQGLKAEEVTKRLGDAMILSRLSGLGAAEAVAGLTAAINSFNREGITSEQVLNKLSAAAVKAAVSEKDLIEGLKRSSSVAVQAGVSLDELVGVITAVQQKTARGGAVIGNSFKTIFTRIQSLDKLKTMQHLGVQVTDLSGEVLSGTKLIENLANTIKSLPDARKLQIAEGLVGKFQVAPFLAILDDYSQKTSTAIRITGVSQQATQEAYTRNVALNQTLSAALNETVLNVKELANTLGEIGVTDNLQNVLGFFSSLVEKVKGVMEGEGIGSDFARGIVKGIGNIISGPGLAIAGAIIAKLTIDLARFGVGSLQTFFGLNRAAKEQAALQGQIASTLLGSKSIQAQIMAIENSTLTVEQKRLAQTRFFTTALNEQAAIMTRMQGIAVGIAPGVMRGTRGPRGKAAGGYIPNFNATMGYGSEQANINRGVGGAPKGARPVAIPNFNFGGGQRGTMVANDSEFVVDNFKGKGGSAIFNQNMVSSMGLPTGARKIGAAGGYIPNFASPTMMNKMGGYVMLTGERANKPTKQTVYTGIKKKTKATRGYNLVSSIDFRPETVQAINVPIHGLPSQAETKGKGESSGVVSIDTYKEALEKNAVNQALTQARALSGGKMPTPLKRGAIENKINQGALKGFAGTIYELTLATLLTDKEFKKYIGTTDTSNFDLNLQGQEKLKKLYNITGNPRYGEVKGYKGPDNIKSVAAKIFRVMGPQGQAAQTQKWAKKKIPRTDVIRYNASLGGSAGQLPVPTGSSYQITGREGSTFLNSLTSSRGGGGMMNIPAPVSSRWTGLGRGRAGGYIPNYANPLQEAIGRERNAGLPLNQIRVNQAPRLRNAGNPQGLAVTNTRDEPTGRIPSFANGPAGSLGFGGAGRPAAPAPAPAAAPSSPTRSVSSPMVAASGDLMMKFMGLTMAASMLQGMFSQVGDETSDFSEGMSKATQALMMMAMMSMMGGSKLGFGPLAAGKMGKAGANLRMTGGVQSGVRQGPLPKGIERGGGMGKRIGGGALTSLSMFGRLLPVVGQLAFAFMGLNAVLKMFGKESILDPIKESFKNFGMKIGLVDTPVEKAAKALEKLTDASYAAAAAQGFKPERADEFFEHILKSVKESSAKRTPEGKGAEAGKAGQMVIEKTFEQRVRKKDKVDEMLLKMVSMEVPVGRSTDVPAWAAGGAETTRFLDIGKPVTTENFFGNMEKGVAQPRFVEMGANKEKKTVEKLFEAINSKEEQVELVKKLEAARKKALAAIRKAIKDGVIDVDKLNKIVEENFKREQLDLPKGSSSSLAAAGMGAVAAMPSMDPIKGERLASADLAMLSAFGGKEEKADLQHMFDLGLVESAEKQIDKIIGAFSGETKAVADNLRLAIEGGNAEDILAAHKEFLRVRKDITVEQEKTHHIEKIQERLAKARISNMVEIQKIQSQMVSSVELEQRGRLSLLSTSLQERGVIGKSLRDAEEKRKLIGAQIDLTSKLVESESAFAFTMKAKGVTEDIPLEDYGKIQTIMGETIEDLKAQGGWNNTIRTRLVRRITLETDNAKLAEKVADLLEEQSEHVRKKSLLERLGSVNKIFQKTIDESILNTQKRQLEIMKAQLSVSAELKKISVSKARGDLRIAKLEGQKVGGGKARELEIDKLISAEREKQARLTHKAAKKSIREGVRQELFARAEKGGLDLGQLGTIQAALKEAMNVEQFNEIASGIEEMSKKQEVQNIKEIADEKLAVLNKIQMEKLGVDYVYNALVAGGKAIYTAFSWAEGILATQTQRDIEKLEGEMTPSWLPWQKPGTPEQQERLEKLKAQNVEYKAKSLPERQREMDQATAMENARIRSNADHNAKVKATNDAAKKAISEALGKGATPSPKLSEMPDDFKLSRLQMKIDIQGIANALAEGGAYLNTFAQQVIDFVFNLRQSAEDLKFRSYATTDPMGILADARDKTENTRLQALSKQGLTPEEFAQQGIAAGAESKAIQGLKDQAFLSPTAAGARSFTRQIPVLEEIFEVKKKFLAGTISEVEATERLLVLEKKRLQVNESLSAKLKNAFVFTQEEIQNKLTTELVDGAKQFTKAISDGLVDAIAKGDSLKDTLLSAATEFFQKMAKSHMSAAFDQITSLLGGGGGGGGNSGGGGGSGGAGNFMGSAFRWLGGALGAASGGPVTGGSGTRDDVPAMLMSGEYVVRKSAVKKYGPEFLEALNREGIQTMARGGVVGQGGRGNFITPGFMGRGAIVGKENLLHHATQSGTMGRQDQIFGGEGFGSVALEPQSMRLTHFGRGGKRALEEQESKKVSLGLYFQQLQAEEAVKKANEERKKEFWNSIAAAAISVGINQFATGFSESMQASKGVPGQGMFSRLSSATGSGFSGFEFGGQRHGGLFNLRGASAPLPSVQRQRDVAGRFATGGPVGGIDTVPAMLSDGEFVMNHAATENIGRGKLSAMNAGSGGNGGDDAIVAAINNLGNELGERGETVINITVNSDGTETQDDQGADEQQQNLAERIRDVVRATIEEEKRLGGSLTQARA